MGPHKVLESLFLGGSFSGVDKRVKGDKIRDLPTADPQGAIMYAVKVTASILRPKSLSCSLEPLLEVVDVCQCHPGLRKTRELFGDLNSLNGASGGM
jgi:hypothetical protein